MICYKLIDYKSQPWIRWIMSINDLLILTECSPCEDLDYIELDNRDYCRPSDRKSSEHRVTHHVTHGVIIHHLLMHYDCPRITDNTMQVLLSFIDIMIDVEPHWHCSSTCNIIDSAEVELLTDELSDDIAQGKLCLTMVMIRSYY